ncbi:hypothetical protein PTT_05908 [Pyrenophora teres f. teres 0-1]|uniref:Uncharacterized protein n=1 Tax=Pyrenophora teres f. teres (strain 0-1) TaxID=861557 RepID=E3RF95_PYRTT|nr:hypothetical protein PTT_05908 [Pyrenophora teres f. teres 0-1]
MASVAGAQPPPGPPPGGHPPGSPLPSSPWLGPVPPTRKCSRRTCAHYLTAPEDLKADGSDYYAQCFRCRGSTKILTAKRRRMDATTAGVLAEPGGSIDRSSSSIQLNLPFAGVNVILVGDFYQLPPVAEKSLFNTTKTQNPNQLLGQALYRLFNQTITLDVVKRQQASFEDAIRIYSLKDNIKAFNHYRLRQLKRPVLLVNASHTGGTAAENANTDEARNLHKDIPISINARIMLRDNL